MAKPWFTGDPDALRWGRQLQGDQLRLAIVMPGHQLGYGRTAKNRAAREEEAGSALGVRGEVPARTVRARTRGGAAG